MIMGHYVWLKASKSNNDLLNVEHADEAVGVGTENMIVSEGVGAQNSSDAFSAYVMEGGDSDGVVMDRCDTKADIHCICIEVLKIEMH